VYILNDRASPDIHRESDNLLITAQNKFITDECNYKLGQNCIDWQLQSFVVNILYSWTSTSFNQMNHGTRQQSRGYKKLGGRKLHFPTDSWKFPTAN